MSPACSRRFRGWCARWAGLGFAAASAACSQPAAGVVVAWIEGREDGNGNRDLEVYDAGVRWSIEVIPTVPGSDAKVLSLEVDSRGDGVAVSGENSTTYVSLRHSRQPSLTKASAQGRDLVRESRLTRNADAVLRAFDAPLSGLGFMPVTGASAGTVNVLEPPEALRGGVWQLLHAADAPVFFWVEQSGFPIHVDGHVEAVLYPSIHRGPRPAVTDLQTLAIGRVQGRGVPEGFQLRASDQWCPGRTCVAPDGRSLTAMGEAPCTVWWWRWEEADDPTIEVEPELVVLDQDGDQGCVPGADPHLLAQLEHDIVVLDDEIRIYVGDLSTGKIRSGTKVWDLPAAHRLARRGRSVTIISPELEVVSVDATGVRTISAERAPCPSGLLALSSPSGLWTLATCTGDGTFVPEEAGSVYRVSPLGLEILGGVAMVPLGIDDEGNGLLYSYEPQNGEPLGLFVLAGDGQLARVDDLEPEPALVTTGDLQPIWFGQQFLRP